jgi:hypothetical protein
MLLRLATPLVLSLASVACIATAPVCRVGADCASGVCNADGTCGGTTTGTGGSGASTAAGGSGTTGTGGTTGNGGAPACLPNNDFVVTRAEMPLAPGLHAEFRAAEKVSSVSTAGTSNPDGSRAWDLSVAFSGDHGEPLQTLDLSTQWFGKDFPGATYAARLSDSADLLGVFTLTATALQLVGVASPASGNTQTELKYAPAVTVVPFPIQMGATWTTASMVTGMAQGLPVAYYETYQSSVDAFGSLKTPYAVFDVLRVNTLLTRVVGGVTSDTRTFAFVTDCFGTVATIVSNTDELVTEFTSAAEVTRLAP